MNFCIWIDENFLSLGRGRELTSGRGATWASVGSGVLDFSRTDKTTRARKLRSQQTPAERLLWSLLRANQLSGLKFRRQFPIGNYFADFACVERKLIIELDGEYHDYTEEEDAKRHQAIEAAGWSILRFANEEILGDPESVLVAIAKTLDTPFEFRKRKGEVAGSDKRFRGC